MRLDHYWSDDDTVMAARFDDGWTVAATEKAAVTINAEGVIVGTWWKEEPTEWHWQFFVSECGKESTQHPRPIGEAMDDMITKAGHYDGETAAEAARDLKALIDALVS
jgi:hypothetical protein